LLQSRLGRIARAQSFFQFVRQPGGSVRRGQSASAA
jgi:hypothetical protein